MTKLLHILLLTLLLSGCSSSHRNSSDLLLFENRAYPHAVLHDGMYYLTLESDRKGIVEIWASPTVEGLADGEYKVITDIPANVSSDIYSPELHRIADRWYIYFEADDGTNTDTHQLYVIENSSPDPMKGTWQLHGPIITNDEWNFGLHPTTFILDGRQYLLWSGWPKRRVESETQCIYIAEMASPWTLKSGRVMISMPEYEWERQWINPDGSRSAYPIFVNENPEVLLSPDGKRVVVAYSASGIWTVFTTLGLLYAKVGDDLLDPASWVKEPEPFFRFPEESGIEAVSNISLVPSDDDEHPWVIYQCRVKDDETHTHHAIKARRISWSEKSLPVFTSPEGE